MNLALFAGLPLLCCTDLGCEQVEAHADHDGSQAAGGDAGEAQRQRVSLAGKLLLSFKPAVLSR